MEDGLKRASAQHIRGLSAALRMTVQTAVLKAGEGVIIDKAAWPIDRWGGSWVGHHFDLHCTAQGKALIAWLTDEEIGKLFLNLKLAKFNSKTITSLDKLKEHLADIRKKGYALNDEEHILGIRAIGAPVFSHVGNVVASVSVRGSTAEIPYEQVESLAREIIRTTHFISRDFQNPATC
jgi:DNA-binding IclR family transcriptional regulator